MVHGQDLADHPTQRHPHDVRRLPTERVEDGDGIPGQILQVVGGLVGVVAPLQLFTGLARGGGLAAENSAVENGAAESGARSTGPRTPNKPGQAPDQPTDPATPPAPSGASHSPTNPDGGHTSNPGQPANPARAPDGALNGPRDTTPVGAAQRGRADLGGRDPPEAGQAPHTPGESRPPADVVKRLASGMETPTDEMIMAASGRDVGSDLANRLGDPDYVLVPNDPADSSLGARVLRRDELDAGDPSQAADRAVPMDDPRADSIARQIAARRLLESWEPATGPGARSTAMRQLARDDLGLDRPEPTPLTAKAQKQVDMELLYNRGVFGDFLRTHERGGETPAAADRAGSSPRAGEVERPDSSRPAYQAEAATSQPDPATGQSGWQPGLGPTPAELDRVPELLRAGPDADYPSWWPQDHSGYHVQQRELDVIGRTGEDMNNFVQRKAPLGMSPAQYQQFSGEMLDALRRDGVTPDQVDVRLQGSSANFFSGAHKQLQNLPLSEQFLRDWFGDAPGPRPQGIPFDVASKQLGDEPSDYDMNFSSTKMVDLARSRWPADRPEGDFMSGHGYLDKGIVEEAFPALQQWKAKWEEKLEREVSIGVFDSSGPFNTERMGRPISVHHRNTDWMLHRPGSR